MAPLSVLEAPVKEAEVEAAPTTPEEELRILEERALEQGMSPRSWQGSGL